MSSLTPRQRIIRAVNHQEPDRVPLALWGSWYGVTDKLYFNVLKKLGWDPVDPFRPDLLHSVNYYDEIERRIQQLAPGGGYILAPANHLQWDIPPENLLALYRQAREFGRYPIGEAISEQ